MNVEVTIYLEYNIAIMNLVAYSLMNNIVWNYASMIDFGVGTMRQLSPKLVGCSRVAGDAVI